LGVAVDEDLAKNWPKMPSSNAAGVFNDIIKVIKKAEEENKKARKAKKQPKGKTKRRFRNRRGLTDTDFSDTKLAHKVSNKLRIACQSTLFRDIMKTILKYGWNPQVGIVSGKNHKLNLLVK
jgi:hypothetical protein